MLVEDDNNLREIYEARLAAEGYDIVAAQDGEEALALAVKERPDLIIADIMMPKVSGFDMLDILRSTPETKHTKIIMMTALSQAEDKTRAEKLGADRYLVKSQVTLEDVVKVASEMLNQTTAQPTVGSAPDPDTPVTDPASSIPTVTPTSEDEDLTPALKKPSEEPDETPTPIKVATEPQPAEPDKTAASSEEQKTSEPVDTSATDPVAINAAKLSSPAAEEEAQVTQQIDEFISTNPTLSASADPEKEKEEVAAPAKEVESSKPTEANTEGAFKEEIITASPVVAPSSTPKATNIPITVADENPPRPRVAAPSGSEADKTMAKAVDSLMSKDEGVKTPVASEPTSAPEVEPNISDKPQAAKKRGGERVIEPLSNPKDSQPDLDALLAREEGDSGISVPPANAVIAPGGNVTSGTPVASDSNSTAQPAFSDGNIVPGAVVQPPSSDPANPDSTAANNISI